MIKKSKNKKLKKKKTKKGSNNDVSDNVNTFNDSGLVVIDDNLKIDKEAEREERKAYLEESRSQDSSD